MMQNMANMPLNTFNMRRDSSIYSSSSSSSQHSSVSSQKREQHQNNMKLVIEQAIRDYNNLSSENDKRQYLIQKSFLLARDKKGCQMLQNKITEEMAWLS